MSVKIMLSDSSGVHSRTGAVLMLPNNANWCVSQKSRFPHDTEREMEEFSFNSCWYVKEKEEFSLNILLVCKNNICKLCVWVDMTVVMNGSR